MSELILPRRSLLTGAAAMLAASQLPNPATAQIPAPVALSWQEKAYRKAAITLFQDFYAQGKAGENVAFSPTAVIFALMEPAVGLSGQSADAIKRLFGTPNKSLVEISQAVMTVDGNMEPPQGSEVKFSRNGEMWVAQNLTLSPKFEKDYKDGGNATAVKRLDFTRDSAKSADVINNWIEEVSPNIGKLRLIIPTATRWMSAGAMDFDAPWETVFDPKQTTPGTFNVAGKEIATRMMHNKNVPVTHYVPDNQAYEYASYPFKDGYEFFAIKPKASLDDTVKNLPAIFDEVTANLQGKPPSKMDIHLPHIKIDATTSFIDALSKGSLKPLTENAKDFEGIAKGAQNITMALQAMKFAIDERHGTASAAALATSTRAIHPSFSLDRDAIVGFACTRPGGAVPIALVALRNPTP